MRNTPNTSTEKTPQNLFNLSYDKSSDLLAIELLGFDGTNPTRLATDSNGQVKLDPTNLFTQSQADGLYARKNLTPISVTEGSNISFTYDGITPDEITSTVHIARDAYDGIYNSVTESAYNNPSHSPILSPENTEWNADGWENLPGLKSRTFQPLLSLYTVDFIDSGQIVGPELIMHIISEDKYYKVKFTGYDPSGYGGTFAYDRTELTLTGIKEEYNFGSNDVTTAGIITGGRFAAQSEKVAPKLNADLLDGKHGSEYLSKVSNRLIVSPSGGDFTTVADAVTYAMVNYWLQPSNIVNIVVYGQVADRNYRLPDDDSTKYIHIINGDSGAHEAFLLFSHDNGSDTDIYGLVSLDGKDWRNIRTDGRYLIRGTGGTPKRRDPSMIYYRGTWYLIVNDVNTSGNIKILTSTDLINYSNFVTISTGLSGDTWAKDWFLDTDGMVYITFGSSSQGPYICYPNSRNPSDWSDSANWTTQSITGDCAGTGVVYDAQIKRYFGTYFLYSANATYNPAKLFMSNSVTGDYHEVDLWGSQDIPELYEAFTMCDLPDGRFRLYGFTHPTSLLAYADSLDKNFVDFEPSTVLTGLPPGKTLAHGDVLRITNPILINQIMRASEL